MLKKRYRVEFLSYDWAEWREWKTFKEYRWYWLALRAIAKRVMWHDHSRSWRIMKIETNKELVRWRRSN